MPTTYAVPDGRTAMAATTYTGTGAALSVSNAVNGVSFQPDMVWIKSRSAVGQNTVQDVIRGVNKYVITNSTGTEGTDGSVTSFNSNGFSLTTDAGVSYNVNGTTYVGWQWKAGGTAVTNTAGSVTSTVSANTTTGFSVVTASLSGTSPVTIGHGLGVAPKFIIGKVRNNSTNWYVYSSNFSASDYLILNNTDAKATSSNIWDVAPTSTVFTVGNPQNGWNGGTSGSYNYIFYCWAEIAGFSKFGSYVGNGSTDGTFVYTGFRPRFLLVKTINTAGYSWTMYDSSRNTYNAVSNLLYANLSNAENTGTARFDFLSNGFKNRDSSNDNVSGNTYIYMAFAENPFKYSNAR
jgi:hypothetical protein